MTDRERYLAACDVCGADTWWTVALARATNAEDGPLRIHVDCPHPADTNSIAVADRIHAILNYITGAKP